MIAGARTLLLLSTAIPVAAAAQSVAPVGSDLNTDAQSNFARDRDVSVRERPRPDYEAAGIPLGAFMMYPRIEGDVEYDDNIFALTNHKVGDTIYQAKPDVVVQSTWSRNFLRFDLGATVNQYAQHTAESTTDWTASAHGGLDFAGKSQVTADAETDSLTEPRTSSNEAVAGLLTPKPVRYFDNLADVGWTKEFNRLKLSVRGDVSDFHYQNQPGFEEDLRDRTITSGTGRLDYALSPATAMFFEATLNNRDFRLTPPPGQLKQDSSGYEALAGVNFELTHLMRGEVGVGYLNQSYKAAGLKDISGLGYRAKLEWFPTQLTTVSAYASRSVQDSGVVAAGGLTGGYLYTDTGVQVDHELLRNLILSGAVSYTNSDYKEVSRTDDRWLWTASATYLMTRRVGVNFGVSSLHQNSFGSAAPILLGNKFTDNKVKIGIVLAF
jgi:hypothetical protein